MNKKDKVLQLARENADKYSKEDRGWGSWHHHYYGFLYGYYACDGENEFYTLLCAARDMLTNLKRCGDFYFRVIELDRHVDSPIDGEDLEKDINKLLEMINERCA